MKCDKDIEAIIHFLPTEAGGRKGPAFSNYRPQFYYDSHDWDAVHEYPDVTQVNPGDTVRTYLSFLSPQCHVEKIYIGMKFQIREGARTVGEGEVTKIINLKASAKRRCENDPDCMKGCEH